MTTSSRFSEIVSAHPAFGAAGDLDRAARLPRFLGFDGDARGILDRLKVLLVGAGSVGRHVALHLARCGIGELRIADRAAFKRENLLTQAISPTDVGELKASNAARLCLDISPQTRTLAFDGPVEAIDLAEFSTVGVVVLATDNLAAEVEVGQRCLWLGVPLVQASVDGPTLVAQVRVYRNGEGGACPACGFGRAEWAALNEKVRFPCGGDGPGERTGAARTVPTMSISFLCSLAADLALVQVFRLVLGLGPPPGDSLLEYCGYTHRSVVSPLVRKEACACEHTRWRRIAARRPLRQCTLGELAELGGISDTYRIKGAALTVGGYMWIERARCTQCGRPSGDTRRFAATYGPEPQCCETCGGTVRGEPFHTHHRVPLVLLRSLFDRTLAELGGGDAAWVVVRGLRGAAFID